MSSLLLDDEFEEFIFKWANESLIKNKIYLKQNSWYILHIINFYREMCFFVESFSLRQLKRCCKCRTLFPFTGYIDDDW